jgi:hypothetical protein
MNGTQYERRSWCFYDNGLSRKDRDFSLGPHDMNRAGKTRIERMDHTHNLDGLIRIRDGSPDEGFLYGSANPIHIPR